MGDTREDLSHPPGYRDLSKERTPSVIRVAGNASHGGVTHGGVHPRATSGTPSAPPSAKKKVTSPSESESVIRLEHTDRGSRANSPSLAFMNTGSGSRGSRGDSLHLAPGAPMPTRHKSDGEEPSPREGDQRRQSRHSRHSRPSRHTRTNSADAIGETGGPPRLDHQSSTEVYAPGEHPAMAHKFRNRGYDSDARSFKSERSKATTIQHFIGAAAQLNLKFEDVFGWLGRQVGRYPYFLFCWTLIVFLLAGSGCVLIELEDDFLNLVLADDSLIRRINTWQSDIFRSCDWAPNPSSQCGNASASSAGSFVDETTQGQGYCVNETEEWPYGTWVDTDTSQNTATFLVLQGAKPDETNMLSPEYFLEYRDTMERFLVNWTMTCDEFDAEDPDLKIGYRDIAKWEYYDPKYAAIADFPIHVDEALMCFKEGGYTYFSGTNNSQDIYDVLSNLNPESNEWKDKVSLEDILNFPEDEAWQRDREFNKAIMGCWSKIPVWRAKVPWTFLYGGATFPMWQSPDDVGEDLNFNYNNSINSEIDFANGSALVLDLDPLAPYVMVNTQGVEWLPGQARRNCNKSEGCDSFTVLDAVEGFPLEWPKTPGNQLRPEVGANGISGQNASYTEMTAGLAGMIAIQGIARIGSIDEFAKRLQRKHFKKCAVVGDGEYNCCNDKTPSWDWIRPKAATCYKKVIENLAEEFRDYNNRDASLKLNYAMLMPYDAETVLRETGATNALYLLICIGIMFGYIIIATSNPCDCQQSKSCAGGVGVILVCLSTLAGMGFTYIILRFKFTASTLQVLPFLGLGLGVDDMLVLLWTYSYQKDFHKIEAEMDRTMRKAGASIMLTTTTNFFSFFIGTFFPLKELTLFAKAASIVEITNFIVVLIGFASFIVIDNRWRSSKIVEELGDYQDGARGVRLSLSGGSPRGSPRKSPRSDGGRDSIISHRDSILQDWRIANEHKPCGYKPIKKLSFQCLNVIPSCIIFLLSMGLVGVASYGALYPGPDWGLSLSDLIPEGHGLSPFFHYLETYFQANIGTQGFGYKWDGDGDGSADWFEDNYFGERFDEIKAFMDEMGDLDRITPDENWLTSFDQWAATASIADYVGVPSEDDSNIAPQSKMESTDWPPNEGCTSDGDPYTLCRVVPELPIECFNDGLCSLAGSLLCGAFDCSSCEKLLQVAVKTEQYQCQFPTAFDCPEYRWGGGKCLDGSAQLEQIQTALAIYVARVGVCPILDNTDPFIDDAVADSKDIDACMEWCDQDDTCTGFTFEWHNRAGCRRFDSTYFSGCADGVAEEEVVRVNGTYTEEHGTVTFWRQEIKNETDSEVNTDEQDCKAKGEIWAGGQTISSMVAAQYRKRCFMPLLRSWVRDTDAKYELGTELQWSNGNSIPGDDDYLIGGESTNVINAGLFEGALTSGMIINVMRTTEAVSKKHPNIGAYATGIIYLYYDQFLRVDQYLWSSLAFIGIVVFVCALMFLLHPVAAFIMLFCLTATIFEIYGFLYWTDVKINGILALNMVVACGISVEFSAHINRHFMLAAGLPRYRMAAACGHMFLPVTLGAITTVLSVSFMAFSDVPYTRVYYFRLFCVITAFGWWNGVFLQSVMLVWATRLLHGTCFELNTISIEAEIDLDQQRDSIRGAGAFDPRRSSFLEDLREKPQKPGRSPRGSLIGVLRNRGEEEGNEFGITADMGDLHDARWAL